MNSQNQIQIQELSLFNKYLKTRFFANSGVIFILTSRQSGWGFLVCLFSLGRFLLLEGKILLGHKHPPAGREWATHTVASASVCSCAEQEEAACGPHLGELATRSVAHQGGQPWQPTCASCPASSSGVVRPAHHSILCGGQRDKK